MLTQGRMQTVREAKVDQLQAAVALSAR